MNNHKTIAFKGRIALASRYQLGFFLGHILFFDLFAGRTFVDENSVEDIFNVIKGSIVTHKLSLTSSIISNLDLFLPLNDHIFPVYLNKDTINCDVQRMEI